MQIINISKLKIRKKMSIMGLFGWLGGLVLFTWLGAIIFRIGNALMHNLVTLAAILFIIDLLYNKEKSS